MYIAQLVFISLAFFTILAPRLLVPARITVRSSTRLEKSGFIDSVCKA
ncbi:MAG TPA: hypothetical protein VK200_05475 [Candidatus Limnocylindrales bacterium]|nr:hypothetical protein [Candidatus Limnocylindrales bacterium]